MEQIYPDLWQTRAEHPFPSVTSHAYLLVRDNGNILFYSSGLREEYQHIFNVQGRAMKGAPACRLLVLRVEERFHLLQCQFAIPR